MVKELMGRVEQYEQSYSEEGDSEGEFDGQSQELQQAQYECNQPLLTDTEPRCEKAQSEPTLSEPVPALNPGKISQSVQTLFPHVHKPSTFAECEHKRPASACTNITSYWIIYVFPLHVILHSLMPMTHNHLPWHWQPWKDSMINHQLALKEIQTILNTPKVAHGDTEGFQNFVVRVRSLVGMLQSINSREQQSLQSLKSRKGAAELACASFPVFSFFADLRKMKT